MATCAVECIAVFLVLYVRLSTVSVINTFWILQDWKYITNIPTLKNHRLSE